MRLPEETVVESFLPTFRFMLARELESRGLKEGRIAAMLGLSQAAVSKYHRGKTKKEQRFLDDAETQNAVREIADGLVNGGISGFQVLSILLQLVRKLETRGLMCRLHEEEFPAIAGLGCNLCLVPRGGEALEEENVLSNVRAALRLLESTPGFPALIPNVGSNLAMAKKDAKDFTDVAAVPGRIYEMRGAVKIPAVPELSASRHVAGIVLAVARSNTSMRAAVNIKFSEDILKACGSIGWKSVEIASEYEGRGTELTRKLARRKVTPEVIYHRGGFGIEPIVYIVGESAIDVVEKVRLLISNLNG